MTLTSNVTTTREWHARPVFVSSTFRDMNSERDVLRDVWTDLEERSREIRMHFEHIDLRVGVETLSIQVAGTDHPTNEQLEEAKQMLVLRVCFDEVKRSRPFLVVLLGDRYGWVPPVDFARRIIEEQGVEISHEGTSVTELEIILGAFECPEPKETFFYFREPLPYALMSDAEQSVYRDPPLSSSADRLLNLKERIRKTFPGRVRDYRADWDVTTRKVTGLDQLREWIRSDLWDALKRAASDNEPGAHTGDVDNSLDQFVARHTQDFRGRELLLDSLMRVACQGSEAGACVVGSSGAGKSSIFAKLYRMLQERSRVESFTLLAHSAGGSSGASSIDGMLTRWCAQLSLVLGEPSNSNRACNSNELEHNFSILLARATESRRVVLLVDALDQFDDSPRSRRVSWLPHRLPSNAVFIATSTSCEAASALKERQQSIPTIPLTALTRDETIAVAQAICSRYHRTLNPDVLSDILKRRQDNGSPVAENPLWLTLVVESLNLLDGDDLLRADEIAVNAKPDERLVLLMRKLVAEFPPTVSDLYRDLFQRAEKALGFEAVSAFLSISATSRSGLRESDFRALLPELTGSPWNDLSFAQLRRAFRAHLRTRKNDGWITFSHAQMRLAVNACYLTDPTRQREIHRKIANHLETIPNTHLYQQDTLVSSELLHHFLNANEIVRAAKYLGQFGTPEIRRMNSEACLRHALSVPDGMERLLRIIDCKLISEEERWTLLLEFSTAIPWIFEVNGAIREAIELCENAVACLRAEQQPVNPYINKDCILDGVKQLSQLYFAAGELAKGEQVLRSWIADQHYGNDEELSKDERQKNIRVLLERSTLEFADGRIETGFQLLGEAETLGKVFAPEQCDGYWYAPDWAEVFVIQAHNLSRLLRFSEALDPCATAWSLLLGSIEFLQSGHYIGMSSLGNDDLRIVPLLVRCGTDFAIALRMTGSTNEALDKLIAVIECAAVLEQGHPEVPTLGRLSLEAITELGYIHASVTKDFDSAEAALTMRTEKTLALAQRMKGYADVRAYVASLNDLAGFIHNQLGEVDRANSVWWMAHCVLRQMVAHGMTLDAEMADLLLTMDRLAGS